MPPVALMLAKPVAEIPAGQLYEPKWDGVRSIIFRDRDDVEMGSRNERPMTRYFPEIVAAVLANFPKRVVIDREIVIADTERNTLDFEALQQRIHPAASRVKLLAEQTPASLHLLIETAGREPQLPSVFEIARCSVGARTFAKRPAPDTSFRYADVFADPRQPPSAALHGPDQPVREPSRRTERARNDAPQLRTAERKNIDSGRLRIRRLGVRVPSGAQHQMAPGLRKRGSGTS
jgi:hypothetical protein